MSTLASRHAPFELLRFAAMPTGQEVAIVELEGRFPAARERFARRPVLVIEDLADRPIELQPVWSQIDGERWLAIFAAPDEVLAGGRFALGVRGALLELPEPDRARDADRIAALAREANTLRRRLEHAEAENTELRESAAAEMTAVVESLEAAAAQRLQDAEIAAAQRIEETERSAAERADALEEASALRVQAAEERADRAEQALQAAEAGIDVLRTELAEERERAQGAIAELQQRLEEVRAGHDDVPDAPAPTFGPPAPLAEPDAGQDDDTAVLEPDTDDDATAVAAPRRVPLEPPTAPVALHHNSLPAGRWIALGALFVCAVIFLALLFGLFG